MLWTKITCLFYFYDFIHIIHWNFNKVLKSFLCFFIFLFIWTLVSKCSFINGIIFPCKTCHSSALQSPLTFQAPLHWSIPWILWNWILYWLIFFWRFVASCYSIGQNGQKFPHCARCWKPCWSRGIWTASVWVDFGCGYLMWCFCAPWQRHDRLLSGMVPWSHWRILPLDWTFAVGIWVLRSLRCSSLANSHTFLELWPNFPNLSCINPSQSSPKSFQTPNAAFSACST